MDIQLLGPVRASASGKQVGLGARKQRLVLAVLALEANRQVATDRLVSLLWPDEPPATARGMIHTYVSGLRSALAKADVRLESEGSGYALRCPPETVDVYRFHALVAGARDASGDEERATALEAALELWRGSALAGTASGEVRSRLCAGLEEARLTAVEELAEALIRLDRQGELLERLLALADEFPYRPRLAGALMRTLHRAGRTAEAAEAYQRVRQRMLDELGLEPPADLRDLHVAILRDDPGLGPVAEDSPPEPPGSRPVSGRIGPRLLPRQLPADLATFTGRTAELEKLAELAGSSPGLAVLVIHGMAGAGKTALAVHAGHRMANTYADGQLFVDLHGYTEGRPPQDPSDVLDRLLRCLGVPGEQIPDDRDSRAALYRTCLAGRQMLLVLDNAAAEEQVRPLLPGVPGCLVLITSRVRLTGLDDVAAVPVGVLPAADARALFTRIAGGGHHPELLEEIVELCGRLPLAIRIAAARLTARSGWTAAHLAARLRGASGPAGARLDSGSRLDELAAGQRSVAAAIGLSHACLTDAQRRMYRRFGLHPGADADAYAAAVLAGAGRPEAERLLEALLEASLLDEPRPGRYRFHDLVREHAVRVAGEMSEDERRSALTRLFDHYAQTASAAALADRPDRAWLDEERDNLLAAAVYAATNGWPRHASRFSQTLWCYLDSRAMFAEARALHTAALTACERAGDLAGQASALANLGVVCVRQGQLEQALSHGDQALGLFREIGDRDGQARVHSDLGVTCWRLGRYGEALEHHWDALSLCYLTGARDGIAHALSNIAVVCLTLGRAEQAAEYGQRALGIFRETSNREGQARVLTNLAAACWRLERRDEALSCDREALTMLREIAGRDSDVAGFEGTPGYLRQALTFFRESGSRSDETGTLNSLSENLRAAGRLDEARAFGEDALTLAGSTGDRYEQARAHDTLARTCRDLGDDDRARRHWRQALIIFTELGTPEAEHIRPHLDGPR